MAVSSPCKPTNPIKRSPMKINPRSQTFLIWKLQISPKNWCLEKKQFNKFKENTFLGDAQGNTITRLMEIMKTTQVLKNGFNRDIGILKRVQAEMKAELKSLMIQLEH